MKAATSLITTVLLGAMPGLVLAQEAATTVVEQAPQGTHFGLGDDIWLGIFMTTAAFFTMIILMVNSTIKNLAETKSLWKPSKEVTSAILLLLVSSTAFAQDASAEAEPLFNMSDTAFWGFATVNLFLMFFALIQVRILRGLTKKIAGLDNVAEPAYVPEEERTPAWEVIWRKLNDHREIKDEKDILLNHNYDGIRELDNNLPPWWKWGFYVSIVFGVFYLIHFHVTKTGALPQEELAIAIEEGEAEVEAYLARMATNVDETSVSYVLADDRIAQGKAVFNKNCVTCHREDLGGKNGPNLADAYWLHGGSIKDVFKTIKYGIPTKGMKSWKADLTPVQIQNVATYILSMQGTNPADAKDPQGDFVDPAVPEGEEVEKAETPETEDPDTEELISAIE
ncbi:cbb3-type cytochrome c oxidase N-terminal domain-containing protein [Sanyastnella coralliicola]|uniref:cbb3-type cytochrome c oxidase N-terminal domain-containing protein n=1 Tax=Sanyastnella coralliicola TaxID=3069118 RepID=UPI0027B9EF38|nr:cbb3-type cytochrome c oxidase N-terminal domain-containing protein [Longitalea sp. SCSIO 12813]